ncbi:MAG: DUF3795 domain-containing protein [Candidatus Marinimicrobia bacterium]|nr:DUF3795 domain-containing protein [Candidatus Neomarinimicrobiota bacterium]MBL7110238.1 DUF3795 domain-containing protein [Candidatus Neomarinimicrobiota bacterium]
MGKIISYCGIICSECPAYIATTNNDDSEKEKVANIWAKEYNAEITKDDINCEGCLSDGCVFNHCNVCEIRKCAKENGVVNCAHCSDYSCEKLDNFFEMAPSAKIVLNEIFSKIK